MTKDFEFYDLNKDPDAEWNLWYLPENATDFDNKRTNELKRIVPGRKDELFNCKGNLTNFTPVYMY